LAKVGKNNYSAGLKNWEFESFLRELRELPPSVSELWGMQTALHSIPQSRVDDVEIY